MDCQEGNEAASWPIRRVEAHREVNELELAEHKVALAKEHLAKVKKETSNPRDLRWRHAIDELCMAVAAVNRLKGRKPPYP